LSVLYFLLTGFSIGALLMGTIMHSLWPDWRWHHEPLHSTIEAVGGLVAIAMAMVLLHTPDASRVGKHRALAAGFVGMGLLEEFHAIASPGNGFVLFRNLASLAGGIGFVLVWRSKTLNSGSQRRWLPWLMGTAALSVGTWFVIFPKHIPEMVRNGGFTPTAVAPQTLACLLFLAALGYFLLDYRRSGRLEDALFACLALLFGMAEFVFMYSVPWDNRWWFWHGLRLMASVLALGYITRSYVQVIADLKASLSNTLHAKETLSQSEGRLRQVLEERERMAQDLHDSTIQSLFAIGLNLERCQRLVSANSIDVAAQLSSAVAGLKAVIRELRGYILGSEPAVLHGRSLEAALSSLVDDMNNSRHLDFRLDIDPVAADRLTPEQGAQLLPIAREAMSNSLRHSRANTGTLALHLHDGSIRLTVEDYGVGFDLATVQGHGHGLNNMQTRVRKLGGRLEVMSEPGRGTQIVCDLPQEEKSDATS
jgi:signal transduction histidine kinase